MAVRSLKFLKSHGCYFGGDVAGFEAEKAQDLIDLGVAVPLEGSGPVAPPAAGSGKPPSGADEIEKRALELADMKAPDAIEQVEAITDPLLLESLLEIEERKTVVDAARHRLDELKQAAAGSGKPPEA